MSAYRDIGRALGERFTEVELTELAATLQLASELVNRAADDLDHEKDVDTDAAANAYGCAAELAQLASAITEGEPYGREDHPS